MIHLRLIDDLGPDNFGPRISPLTMLAPDPSPLFLSYGPTGCPDINLDTYRRSESCGTVRASLKRLQDRSVRRRRG